jgi:hypothetical protein
MGRRTLLKQIAAGTGTVCVVVCALAWSPAWGHHVLGRPAYALNEDSNTPPALQLEVQIGDYFVTSMVFPAFPKSGKPARVHFYAKHLDHGRPYTGEVRFLVRDDKWFADEPELLGVQPPDDNVFRQGMVFSVDGNYIISAEFEANGEPYVIDFPLRIGSPPPIGPLGFALGTITIVLISVSVMQRRRLLRARIRHEHQDARS